MKCQCAGARQRRYFATEKSIDRVTRWLSKVPVLPDLSLPRFAASRVTDDPITANKLLSHVVIERMNARASALHAPDADIARLAEVTEPSSGAPIYMVHGQRDPLADHASSLEWAKRMGPRAHLQSVDTMNHAMA